LTDPLSAACAGARPQGPWAPPRRDPLPPPDAPEAADAPTPAPGRSGEAGRENTSRRSPGRPRDLHPASLPSRVCSPDNRRDRGHPPSANRQTQHAGAEVALPPALPLQATATAPQAAGTPPAARLDAAELTAATALRKTIWQFTESESESESYVTPDGQSASLSWNKALIWGLRTDFYYCQTVAGLLMWGALSDERMRLSFTIAAGPRQRSHSQVRVPWDSRPYFTVSDSGFRKPGGPGPHIYIVREQGDPVIPPDTGCPLRRLLRLAGLRWRYSNTPPQGVGLNC
jgi:hypothetical protein